MNVSTFLRLLIRKGRIELDEGSTHSKERRDEPCQQRKRQQQRKKLQQRRSKHGREVQVRMHGFAFSLLSRSRTAGRNGTADEMKEPWGDEGSNNAHRLSEGP